MEAMKMEIALSAPFDGVVAAVNVRVGERVAEGVCVVRVEAV
jgi:biotin carboxyl carrier protein